jgi:hypothetical protein
LVYPTHRITHRRRDLSVEVVIPESVQQQLHAHDEDERRRARDSICIRFRKTCEQHYPIQSVPTYIEWSSLDIEQLGISQDSLRHPGRSVVDGEECDDCPSCDIGHHERCRSGYCPQAYG